jgi:type IX secretion system PorP/SprF family membrane protein
MKRIAIIIASFALNLSAFAQDRSNSYTNILNPFLRDPSQAGSESGPYAIFNFRNMIGGIEGMPKTYNFGFHAPLTNGMGLGVKVLAVTSGVFQNMNAEGAYSKTITLKTDHTLSFGLSLGIVQTTIRQELLNGQVDLSDQTLLSSDLNKIRLTSGAGITYRFAKTVELGVAFPMLVTGLNPINPMMISTAAWSIYGGEARNWKVKPSVNYYYLTTSPSMIDGLLGLTWNETLTLRGGYRTNGTAIASTGFNFKAFAIQYAYYHHLNGLEKLAPAQHELALSFTFNKPKNHKPSEAERTSEKVINDEIEKLNSRLSNIMKMEKSNPGVLNVKYEINKLNKDIDQVLTNYTITSDAQLQKIKKLQETIDMFIAINSK